MVRSLSAFTINRPAVHVDYWLSPLSAICILVHVWSKYLVFRVIFFQASCPSSTTSTSPVQVFLRASLSSNATIVTAAKSPMRARGALGHWASMHYSEYVLGSVIQVAVILVFIGRSLIHMSANWAKKIHRWNLMEIAAARGCIDMLYPTGYHPGSKSLELAVYRRKVLQSMVEEGAFSA